MAESAAQAPRDAAPRPPPSGAADDVVPAQLVELVLRHSPPIVAEAIRLAAIPFWCDRALLAALREAGDGKEDRLLERIGNLSFVHEDAGRYTYNLEVRRLLLQDWQADRAQFVQANQRALAYFQAQLAALPAENAASREELTQARLYHSLAVDAAAGVALLDQLVSAAGAEHRLAAAERYVSIADEQRDLLPSSALAFLDYAHGVVAQLHERWAVSRDYCQKALAHSDAPADLQARCRRATARALVHEGQWVEAIALHEQALAVFTQMGNHREVALTMNDLGFAHLDLALNAWGGGETYRPQARRSFAWFFDLVGLFPRLPLVCLLVAQLGFRPLLPVLLRVGRGMDWVIARLFGAAAIWFKRAGQILTELDDRAGLTITREEQVRLYLALNHPRQAEAISRSLLAEEGIILGEYRAARTRLNLAEALLRQNQAAEAAACLEQALPVFIACDHHTRVAQTYTRQAQAAAQMGQFDVAAARYQAAIAAWQHTAARGALTDAVEELETLAQPPALSPEARATLQQTGQRITSRLYLARYVHPLVSGFQVAALIALAIVFFFALFLAIRTETGAGVGADAALLTPLYASPEEEFSPSAGLTIEQQTRPLFRTEVAGSVLGLAALGYLLTYTLLGLYLLIRASLRTVQTGQTADVVIEPEGVSREDGSRLGWEAVQGLAITDRRLARHFMASFSGTTILGETTRWHINGFTRHYASLQRAIRARLAGRAAVYDASFTILGDKSGWLFLLSLLYLAAFIVLAHFRPDWLVTHTPLGPYTVADFYGLGYLALAIPLGWWFAVQPLRARLLLDPAHPLIWAAGGIGTAFSAFAILELSWWRFSLARPDIAVGLLGVFLMVFTAVHVMRARRPSSTLPAVGAATPRGAFIYQPAVRWGTLVVALALSAATLLALGRELLSFHALALGNFHSRQAEAALKKGDSAASRGFYEQALTAYERSLAWRPTTATDNNRGSTLTQLDRYQDAIASYQSALKRDPGDLTYLSNLALAYESWAADLTGSAAAGAQAADPYELYDRALAIYERLAQTMRAAPRRYEAQLRTIRLLQAGAYYEQGQIRASQHDDPAQFAKYEAARQAYQEVIKNAAQPGPQASAYAGRGWALFQLRREAPKGATLRRQRLEAARDDFLAATRLDPQQLSAFTGLGWSYYFLSQDYPSCQDGGDADAIRSYTDNLAESIRAFDQVILLQSSGAIHYRTRAQLKYLLSFCQPRYDRNEQLQAAIASYSQALALRIERADWYVTRGRLFLNLKPPNFAEAAANYRLALTYQPDNRDWWQELGGLYLNRLNDVARAAEAYDRAAAVDPNYYDAWWMLGWTFYLTGDFTRSAEASDRAVALRPDEPRTIFNQALADLAAGAVADAGRNYQLGIAAAHRLPTVAGNARLGEAIADLQDIRADPHGLAGEFIILLQNAQTGP